MNEMDMWKEIAKRSDRKTIVMNEAGSEVIDSENFFGRPVLGKIVVLPRESAIKFTCDKSWACISINGVKEPPAAINDCVDILRLHYDDIEFPRGESSVYKIMTAEQANQVWDFVEKVWEKVDLLVIHCAAGISRSSATAQVISEFFQEEYSNYFEQLYSPNQLVCRLLRESR